MNLPPPLDLSGLLPHRKQLGPIVLLELVDGRILGQRMMRYRESWDAIGPWHLITWQEWLTGTWSRPNVPINSLPSTRSRIVECSTRASIGMHERPGKPIMPAPNRPRLHILEGPRRRRVKRTVKSTV